MNQLKHWALILMLLFGITVFAQTPEHDMNAMQGVSSNTVIRGAETPEQIPVSVALRFWLNDVYINGKIRENLLPPVSSADDEILRTTIRSYAKNFNSIVEAYNAQVQYDVDNGTSSADQTRFWDNVYSLVENTKLSLNIQLSPVGQKQLLAQLEGHKRFLHVSKFDAGLGEVAKANLREMQMVAGSPGPASIPMIPNYSVSFSEVPVFPAIGYYDSFSQGNGTLTTVDPNWLSATGYASPQLVNHLVVGPSGSGTENIALRAQKSNALQEVVTVTVSQVPVNSTFGVIFRATKDGNNFYLLQVSTMGGANTMYLSKKVNGTWGTVTSKPMGRALRPGDTIGASIFTNRIGGLLNGGEVLTVLDSSITASGYAGVYFGSGSGTQTSAQISLFNGGYGFAIEEGVTVSGTTSGSGWPANTIHTPVVQVTLGTAGGTNTGAGVSPQTYLSLNNGQLFYAPPNLADPQMNWGNGLVEVQIKCSATLGTFWGLTWPRATSAVTPWVWEATTYILKTGQSGTTLIGTINCTPQTTPPDYNIIGVLEIADVGFTAPQYSAKGLCWTKWGPSGNGQAFTCVPDPVFGKWAFAVIWVSNSNPLVCTYKGTNGAYYPY